MIKPRFVAVLCGVCLIALCFIFDLPKPKQNASTEMTMTCTVKQLNQFLDQVTCPGFTHTVTHVE